MQIIITDGKEADYEGTTEFLINCIKKAFEFGNNVYMVPETLKEFNIQQDKPSFLILFCQDYGVR
jgi:hypothetical protein